MALLKWQKQSANSFIVISHGSKKKGKGKWVQVTSVTGEICFPLEVIWSLVCLKRTELVWAWHSTSKPVPAGLSLSVASPQGRFNYSISNKLLHNTSMSFLGPVHSQIMPGIFCLSNSPDLPTIDFIFYYRWCLFQSRDKIVKYTLLKWLRFIKEMPRELWLSDSRKAEILL